MEQYLGAIKQEFTAEKVANRLVEQGRCAALGNPVLAVFAEKTNFIGRLYCGALHLHHIKVIIFFYKYKGAMHRQYS